MKAHFSRVNPFCGWLFGKIGEGGFQHSATSHSKVIGDLG